MRKIEEYAYAGENIKSYIERIVNRYKSIKETTERLHPKYNQEFIILGDFNGVNFEITKLNYNKPLDYFFNYYDSKLKQSLSKIYHNNKSIESRDIQKMIIAHKEYLLKSYINKDKNGQIDFSNEKDILKWIANIYNCIYYNGVSNRKKDIFSILNKHGFYANDCSLKEAEYCSSKKIVEVFMYALDSFNAVPPIINEACIKKCRHLISLIKKSVERQPIVFLHSFY